MIAKIVINDEQSNVDKIFDYKVPGEMEGKCRPGIRVLVPFGASNRALEGMVVEVCETSKVDKLKELNSILDNSPLLSEEALEMCAWMKEKYFCTLYQAIKLMLPPKMTTRVQEWLVLNPDFDVSQTDIVLKRSKTAKEVVRFLGENNSIAEYGEVYENIKRTNLHRVVCDLKEKGIIEIHEKSVHGIKNKTVRMAKLAISVNEAVDLIYELQNKAPLQSKMLAVLSEIGPMNTADLVMFSEGSYAALTSLKNKGWISIEQETIIREVYSEDQYAKTEHNTPTDEQKTVIDSLKLMVKEGKTESVLLRGVTGSGKTEVFLQVIDYCISLGKQAIVLVPEISLTPQMVERFVGRFGNRIAVMHSGLSAGERFDQWNKIKNGGVDVVVGARSAVFAPFEKPGIIIMDEEHENSYKSEISPRYHARDVAKYRGEKSGAVLLMASATPSLESFYKAQIGEYKLFTMEKRYNKITMPHVKVIDMRRELVEKRNFSPFSEELKVEIFKNLENKEKTILFLNRRGYSTFVSCRQCGHVLTCGQCSISLTYHMSGNRLSCHYCGESQNNVSVCPKCGSKYIKYFGAGTQKVEEEIKKLYPNAKVLRMDVDTTGGKGGHENILKRFAQGDIDILLGTQMVTKGLDFPDVTLVGALAADTSLNIDDFRANERTFAQLTQVCGRAGRGTIPGRALVQTYQPEHYAVQFAKNHDYINFYKSEIEVRRRLEYPPFCDIVSLIMSGTDEAVVEKNIKELNKFLRECADEDNNFLMVLGPTPAPVSKIKKKYRWRIIIKCTQSDNISHILKKIADLHRKQKGTTYLNIDINPSAMN